MPLHLAAAFVFIATATAHAQITNPDNLVAKPPRNPALARPQPTLDLQWLWQYTQPAPDGNEAALIADPRFAIVLREQLVAQQSFFQNGNLPLHEVAERYFATLLPGVTSYDNRYIVIHGCVAHNCVDQGLLWFDTTPRHPAIIFAATQWSTIGVSDSDPNADFDLWLFASASINPEHPPAALIRAIRSWNANAPQRIRNALLIDPDGTPHTIDSATFGATPFTSTNP